MTKMCVTFIFALLAGFYMTSNSVVASSYEYDQEITISSIYDEYQDELLMPEACESSDYCFEKGDNYPEKDIKELLEAIHPLIVEAPVKRIGDRFGENHDCPSTEINKPIYYITDKNNKVRVVVQSTGKFEQIYSVRNCAYEGLITRTSNVFANSNALKTFEPKCVTTKMDLDFFVLSEEKDYRTNKYKIEVANAKDGIPVCCRCQLTKNIEI